MAVRNWVLLVLMGLAVPLPAQENPSCGWRNGLKSVRVILLATDEELPEISRAKEEVEHALEPPMEEKRFWHRKLEILKDLPSALDLVRSYQNVRRVIRLSKDFESPWLRQLLANSATMFSITHGTEITVGVYKGTEEAVWAFLLLLASKYPEFVAHGSKALGWYGLALPGVYDVGCLAGAAVLFLRPTRALFNAARQMAMHGAASAFQLLGGPRLKKAYFTTQTGWEQLEAWSQNQPAVQLEHGAAADRALHAWLLSEAGAFAELYFIPDGSDLVLTRGVFDLERMRNLTRAQLEAVTRGLGWNVRGALRQIHKLLLKNELSLLRHEKSFVSRIQIHEDQLDLVFRPNSVAIAAKNWKRKTESSEASLPCPQAIQNIQ